MTPASPPNWFEHNQRHLSVALAVVRERLEAAVQGISGESKPVDTPQEQASVPGLAPPALETLCATFGLSPFERELLLLCAGVELDARFAQLCAAAQKEVARPHATFSLALAILPEAHWSALTPAGPLRFWRLVETEGARTLVTSPLRIDERILNFLTGVPHLDERLAGMVTPLEPPDELVPSHREIVDRITAEWASERESGQLPVVQLSGSEVRAKREIAAAACARLGLQLSALPASALPTSPAELEALARLWEREAILGSQGLLLDCDEIESGEAGHQIAISQWVERLNSPLIISSRERRHFVHRGAISLQVEKPTAIEQWQLWQEALGTQAAGVNGFVGSLVAQFSLEAHSIREIAGKVRSVTADGSDLSERLWLACCAHAHPRLGELAQKIKPIATWEDLVLPKAELQMLREIAMHVRQRMTVYEDWGFASRSARGLGISTLFSGVSGTGKTMASEVLANELKLDLYRIDLSQVVSKYIGETEKNLRRVFDAAEEGGAILLFDEADALFGKRSEVKDSHDRYANVEISYLLQRMEAYRGLAILTTNMKDALDPAFMRRIRFVVDFPFPDAAQREEIWRRIFPAQTPSAGLAPEKLARLSVTGGNIRNIALYSAFLAAEKGQPVQMAHLLRAAEVEYAKLEKPLSATEIGDWL